MKINSSFFCALLFLFSFNALSAQEKINVLKIDNVKQLQEFFRYTGKSTPIISGHRGGTIKGFPENSIEAFQNTLKYTPAFFEIDPRLTKDSVVVLMHDATLDRTTNGTGKVSDYTYSELQKLRLKDIDGNLTECKIPTLKEAIEWSKGKTILNLDKKDVPYDLQQKLLTASSNKIIMVTVHDAKHAKFYFDKNPETMFSAFVKTKEAFKEYEAAGIPWKNMIAYIGSMNKPENAELYKLLQDKGVMCMISAAPSYDKIEDKAERTKQYQNTFLQGADILESDLPIDVAEAIKSIIPKNNPKKNFFSTSKL